MIKQKTINLIKKYYFVVITTIINICLLFGFFLLYKKVDYISKIPQDVPPTNIVSETKSVFSGIYSNLEDYIKIINSIKLQEKKNEDIIEEFKQKKSEEYLNIFSKDQEEFFQNFQNITGINRFYNE